MRPSTAILFFSLTADAGFRRKLVQRTQRTLAKSGLSVIRSSELDQRGDSFGERITGAIQDVFARGYERVIVVGDDCPDLKVTHFRRAQRLLDRGDHVLGPDLRGGAWIIGLHRSTFRAEAFSQLAWESADLFGELEDHLGEVSRLPVLRDINSEGEFYQFWWRLPFALSLPLRARKNNVLTEFLRGPPAIVGRDYCPQIFAESGAPLRRA